MSVDTDGEGGQNGQGAPVGIVNTIVLNANNDVPESVNRRIKLARVRSRGFRNEACFRDAIYFRLGDPDLYPAVVKTS